jgi:predicted Zn-dependent protease
METMGAQAFNEMKAKQPIETDAQWNRYIRCIALPIAARSGSPLPAEKWEVVLFQDSSANAFALPGGKIGVHVGLLRVAKNDAQLATVLGHEVGHVLASHSNERVSETLAVQLGLAGTAALLSGEGKKDQQKTNLLMAALGIGAQFGILLPHSRGQESEADIIGLRLMARAGFDPQESTALWRNMIQDAGGKAPPEFLSTHPASDNRIQKLEAEIPAVLPEFEAIRTAGLTPRCERPAPKASWKLR